MKLVILVLFAISAVYSYKILCFQTLPSKSHYHLMMGIVKPLVEDGHQITLVTTFSNQKVPKNVKVIDVSHIKGITKKYMNMTLSERSQQSITTVKAFGRNISLATVGTPAVRDLLVKEHFDAVVTEWFFSEMEAGYVRVTADNKYAAIQQVPWIVLSGVVMHSHLEFLVDCVRSVPTIPAFFNLESIPMSFRGRISNTIAYLFMTLRFWANYPTLKSDYGEQFYPLAQSRGVPLPPISEAMHNISIMFLNSHSSFAQAQSLPPNVVEIAGYHIDPDVPPLPEDLQKLFDTSPQGVIYFSMGSVLKSADLPEHTKKNLLKLFGGLPYTVLWKFEEKMENLPKNVHIRPWLPQSSVLSHPNLKIFITHGGLLSTLESLQFGVPIIAIPIFGDQPSNALRSVRAGHALIVTFSPDMAEELKIKVNEMLNNDSYYEKAKYISKLFTNRPVSTTQLIQYYVKLAIESKGAYHLRSKTHLYAWHEAWMLDQLAMLLIVIYLIYKFFQKIFNSFKKGRREKKEMIQKKKIN